MQNSTKPQKRNNKPKFWIAFVVLVIVAGIGYLNREALIVYYAYYFKSDNFNPGDKVYGSKLYEKGQEKYDALMLMRVIRPLTETEIDSLPIADSKKRSLILKCTSAKPYLLFSGKIFTRKAFDLNRSTLMGTFVKTEKVFVEAGPDRHLVKDYYMIINLDPEQAKNLVYFRENMPAGYTWADDNYYVGNLASRNKEAPQFIH